MKQENTKYVSMDMREQIFDLLKERMEIADNHFTNKNWELCFYECMNIQSKIDRIINDDSLKRLIDDMKEKILGHIGSLSIKATSVSERNRLMDSYQNLPILLDWYKTQLNNILFDSGILYPVKNVQPSMLSSLNEENFGMEKDYKNKYLEEVRKLDKEEIIKKLPLRAIEDLYTKMYIENVLQE